MLKNLTSFNFENQCRRENLIWFYVFFGIFILFSTELLNIFESINKSGIFISWIIIIIIFFVIRKKFSTSPNDFFFKELNDGENNFFKYSFIFIFFVTFLTAIIYPPNSPDSHSYHLPKVLHWIQNENIRFYPTAITRQLFLSPFSEYVILHFQLLANGDFLANLVQWSAMIGSAVAISLINKELGGKLRSQFLSILICLTIPMGILQSTSTQTDYVTSLWITILIYFIFRYKTTSSTKYIYGFAFALGLAIMTKQTSYLYCLPFFIWFSFLIFKNPKHKIMLVIIPIIIVLLNGPQYKRNFDLFGNPIGIPTSNYYEDNSDKIDSTINEKINLSIFFSNLVRNISFNLMVPIPKINNITRDTIFKIHDYLNISINDPKTTFGGKYWTFFSFYESYSSNILHFLLIIITIPLLIFGKINKLTKIYTLNIFLGFIFFCIFLKWSPWGNRLLLPFFIFLSPVLGYLLTRFLSLKINIIISIILLLNSFPYLLMNQTRPLLANIKTDQELKINFIPPPYLEKEREELYFTYKPSAYINFKEITNNIQNKKCKLIAIDANQSNENGWEYPLWVMTKNQKNKFYPEIFYINVKNRSNSSTYNKIDKEPCIELALFSYNIRIK